MYDLTNWQDRVVEFEDRYKEIQNEDGTITHEAVVGEVLQEGTPQSATNFNNIEKGVFENRVIELLNAQMNSLASAENLENALTKVEGGTVTQNGTTINVAFNSVRNNANYEVIPIVSKSSGLTNYHFNITAKQANGFLCDVYGEFTSLTIYFLVKGGIL